MFERLAYNLMQRSNFFAPRAVHARLLINGVSDGIRLLVENIDDMFLKARIGKKDTDKGALYKDLISGNCNFNRWDPEDPLKCDISKSTAEQTTTCAVCHECDEGA